MFSIYTGINLVEEPIAITKTPWARESKVPECPAFLTCNNFLILFTHAALEISSI